MKIVHHVAGIVALLLVAGTTLRAQAVPARTGPTSSAMPAVLQNVGFEPPLFCSENAAHADSRSPLRSSGCGW